MVLVDRGGWMLVVHPRVSVRTRVDDREYLAGFGE